MLLANVTCGPRLGRNPRINHLHACSPRRIQQALLVSYGTLHSVPIIIKDLSDPRVARFFPHAKIGMGIQLLHVNDNERRTPTRNGKIRQVWKDEGQTIFGNLAHHAPQSLRRRGSIASRSPSPSKLNPNTVRKMAVPGNSVSQGASRKNCIPKLSMDPQLASGG